MTASEIRQQVFERALGCCEYCQSQHEFSHDDFSIEHITPRSSGGTDDLENLAMSCQGCNNRKYTALEATDPVTGARVSLFHPRLNAWSDHFVWSADTTTMIGLTAIGRASIVRLELNRSGMVNLRRALATVGVHPPFDSPG
jgi:HNH endonuclease